MIQTELVGRPRNVFRIPTTKIPEHNERFRQLARLNSLNCIELLEKAIDGHEWAIEMINAIGLDVHEISPEDAENAERKTISEGKALQKLFEARNREILARMSPPEPEKPQHIQEKPTVAQKPTASTASTDGSRKRQLVFDKYPATLIIRYMAAKKYSKKVMMAIFEEWGIEVAAATFSCQISAIKRGAAKKPTEIEKSHRKAIIALAEKYAEDLEEEEIL